MSDEGIVGSLTHLSRYLDETKARVRQLEEELEKKPPVKEEPDATNTRLQCLQSDNETLRQELSAVKASGKVKKERVDVKLENVDILSAKVPNSVLAESRQMCRDLKKKSADLEGKIQDTAAVAAKALRERLEVEKSLDGVRSELRVLQGMYDETSQANAASTAESASLIERKDAAMVALRAKYDSLKRNQKINDEANEARVIESASLIEDKDATIAELRFKYVTLKTKHKTLRTSSHEYRTNYETVTAEKEELQQTCRELIKVVESLKKKKAAAKCDCRKEIFEQDMRAREEAIEKYRDYMKDLPIPKNLPPSQLDPICRRNSNLHGYLCQDPNAKSFINHILYLPNRTLEISDLQFLAFGPTHRYDRVTEKWTEGSDLTSLHGGTRELFIEREQFIYYMGTYKCHDLRSLHPTGTRLPANVSLPEIHDAALGVPRPEAQIKIVAKFYPRSVIKVEATGLQRVGFNDQLYSSLCQRFATVLGKRKAEKVEKNIGLVKKHKAGGASI